MPLNDSDRRYIIAKHRAVRLTDRELLELDDDALIDLELVKDSNGLPVSLERFTRGTTVTDGVTQQDARPVIDPKRPVLDGLVINVEDPTNPFEVMAAAKDQLVRRHEIKTSVDPSGQVIDRVG